MANHQNGLYGPTGVPAQKVQNSYDKSQLKMIKGMPNISKGGSVGDGRNPGAQHQQRYSPLSDYVKNQNTSKEMQKRMNNTSQHGAGGAVGQTGPQQARNNNFMRPSSANAKRKDLGNAGMPGQSDFNVNLR